MSLLELNVSIIAKSEKTLDILKHFSTGESISLFPSEDYQLEHFHIESIKVIDDGYMIEVNKDTLISALDFIESYFNESFKVFTTCNSECYLLLTVE